MKIGRQFIPFELAELYDSTLCRGHKYRYIPLTTWSARCPLVRRTSLGSRNPKVAKFYRYRQVR